VRLDVADANELVLSMGAAASKGDRVGLADDVRVFAPSPWMWTHLVSVVADAPTPRDGDALLVHLERMPALELERRLVGYYTSWFRELTAPAVMDRALAGDSAAVRAFLRTSMPEDDAWRASLRARLEAGPRRTKRELIDLVDGWNTRVFAPVARESMREVRRVARAARDDPEGETLRELIGGAPVTDGRDLVIVPSAALGEDVHEFDHLRTLFLCVPVRPRKRSPSELGALVGVLADESRASIVTALARESLTAQELADRIGLGLPTTLHHLAALRRTGFVDRGGRRRAYALRREPLHRLHALLEELGASAPE
jgi:DNA-binding transcriptional ArsR family regulator